MLDSGCAALPSGRGIQFSTNWLRRPRRRGVLVPPGTDDAVPFARRSAVRHAAPHQGRRLRQPLCPTTRDRCHAASSMNRVPGIPRRRGPLGLERARPGEHHRQRRGPCCGYADDKTIHADLSLDHLSEDSVVNGDRPHNVRLARFIRQPSPNDATCPDRSFNAQATRVGHGQLLVMAQARSSAKDAELSSGSRISVSGRA